MAQRSARTQRALCAFQQAREQTGLFCAAALLCCGALLARRLALGFFLLREPLFQTHPRFPGAALFISALALAHLFLCPRHVLLCSFSDPARFRRGGKFSGKHVFFAIRHQSDISLPG